MIRFPGPGFFQGIPEMFWEKIRGIFSRNLGISMFFGGFWSFFVFFQNMACFFWKSICPIFLHQEYPGDLEGTKFFVG